MLPFAETVLAWRLARGMTQAELARAAGIPRPNLSAIERGNREVTLKTLRALAAALSVRPGVLADGCAPNSGAPALSRASLERIAAAAAGAGDLRARPPWAATPPGGDSPPPSSRLPSASARELALARNLRIAMAARLQTASRRNAYRRGRGRAEARAYFFLRTTEAPETIATLIARAGGRLVRR